MKLNLGCGRDIRDGWVNVDAYPHPGVDHVVDLDDKPALPFPDDSVDHIEASHLIEHLHHPLPVMEELWRVAKPGAVAVFRCPHGASDNADEDPTHVRRMFPGSFAYFAQPQYWRADYGYRGDWRTTRVELQIGPEYADLSAEEVAVAMRFQRNVVREMVATLEAVKPARAPLAELRDPVQIVLVRMPERDS